MNPVVTQSVNAKFRKTSILGTWKKSKGIQFGVMLNIPLEYLLFWYLFQGFARYMVMLNILLPLLSFAFVFKDVSIGLKVCLGEGYQLFFSTQLHYCSYENLFVNSACWIWFILLSICMSNIMDTFFICSCIREINRSTEKSKKMLTEQAYMKRKRYEMLKKCVFWFLSLIIALSSVHTEE